MKGSMEGVLPMMGLFLIAFILAVQSLPISAALNDIAGDAGTEVGEIAEIKANSDHITNHEIPLAGAYSIDNAAYAVSEENGDINWEPNSFSDESSIISELIGNWRELKTDNFERRINNISECHPKDHDITIEIFPEKSTSDIISTELESTEYKIESEKIICELNNQRIEIDDYSVEDKSANNRYVEVAKAAARFFIQADEEYSEAEVEDTYIGETDSCGPFDDDDTSAEDEAHDDYNDDTPESSDMNVDSADGIEVDWTITDDRDKYNRISSNTNETDNVCARNYDNCIDRKDTSCSSKNATDGECADTQGCHVVIDDLSFSCEDDPDEPYECNEYEPIYTHEKNTTISPTHTSIDFEVKDSDYKILAERNFERLSIEVDDFRFEWD